MTKKKVLTKPKVKKPKPSTLTLRLVPDDVTVVNTVQTITGKKTMTGAIMQAVYEYDGMKKTLEERSNTINELRRELRNMERGIDLIKEGFSLTGITGNKKKVAVKNNDFDDDDEDFDDY